MKTKVTKTLVLTEAELAKILGFEGKIAVNVIKPEYDPREGEFCGPVKIQITWTAEEEFTPKL